MLRYPIAACAAISACTLPLHDAATSGSNRMSPATGQGAGASRPADDGSGALNREGPDPLAGSPSAMRGRRIFSTAFVRTGPEGRLTVELRDGTMVVLRDVVMGPRNYCGTRLVAGRSADRYCGGYAEVKAARPGDAATPGEPG